MPRAFAALALAATGAIVSAQTRDQPAAAQGQPFRTGAHYVRVDAYPSKDGRPVTGLTAADFELLEDGKAQAIDRVEFIDHPAWTPLAERRDPNSQRDGFQLARDATYRVFVLYLDAYHVDFAGSHRANGPIAELLNRMMGPQDLFGVLTPAQTVKDLLLGQLTQSIEEQLATGNWGFADRTALQEPAEIELDFVYPRDGKRLIALRRLDKVYSDLEELVGTLGALREERKNIIFFSDSLVSPPSRFRDMAFDPDPRSRGTPPGIGVNSEGQLTTGARNVGDPDRMRASAERTRLLSIEFDQRFRSLLRVAREANVAFYTVRPGGLDVNSSLMSDGTSNLKTLADETDGVAVLDSNDLRSGLGKIAQDLSSHYVLGYYTNNTRWDGQPRKLTVRLKATGETIRARREYRAPTEAEMSSIRDARSNTTAKAPSPAQAALSELSRISPSQRVQAYGAATGADVTIVAEIAPAEIEAGRWKTGGDVQVLMTGQDGVSASASGRIEPGSRSATVRIPVGDQAGPWQAVVKVTGADKATDSDTVAIERRSGGLLGPPVAYRAASAAASAYKPLATFVFRRTERVRVEWPVLSALESQQGRLLDRNGKPTAVPVATAVREVEGRQVLTADLNLAPLSSGEFLIEVTANGGGKSDQQLIAIRVYMAR